MLYSYKAPKRIIGPFPIVYLLIGIFVAIFGIIGISGINNWSANEQTYWWLSLLGFILFFLYLDWLGNREGIYITDDKTIYSKSSRFLIPSSGIIKNPDEIEFKITPHVFGMIFTEKEIQDAKNKITKRINSTLPKKLTDIPKEKWMYFYLTKKIYVRLFLNGFYLKNKDNKIFCSFSSYTEYRKFLKHLNKVKVTWKFDGFFREETAEEYVGKV